MLHTLHELLGWYGVLALLTGYALISFGVLEARGVIYQLLMLSGCAGLTALSLRKRAYQPAILNAVSGGIAILTLASLLR